MSGPQASAKLPSCSRPPASARLPSSSRATSSRIPQLALPLPVPTHRHPVRVFLPNLFTFLFPIFEGMVLLILELHDGPQVFRAPRTGPAARAGDCVSRLAAPDQCQADHNRSTRVSSHAPVAVLRGQTSREGSGDLPARR